MQQKILRQNVLDTASTYDTTAVREILARATEIESQQQEEALTATQIETLGHELGMSPAAVRQSLREKNDIAQEQAIQLRLPISWQNLSMAARQGTFYTGIAFVVMLTMVSINDQKLITPHSPLWIPLVLALLGYLWGITPAAVFVYGWKRKDWRQGLVLGIVLLPMYLTAAILSILVHDIVVKHSRPFVVESLLVLVYIALISTAAGSIGGFGGGWWHKRKRTVGR